MIGRGAVSLIGKGEEPGPGERGAIGRLGPRGRGGGIPEAARGRLGKRCRSRVRSAGLREGRWC